MAFVKINFNDIEFYERAGSGASGSVYRAHWISRQKIVAVKKLLNSLESEVEVLSTLSHKNIVQFYGAVTEEPHFSIVTEYAEKGCLYDYLAKGPSTDFCQVLQWSQQIALGMNYLHCEAPAHVIHRDLKSRNIVITGDLVTKICDFGSSKFHVHTTKMSLVGTFPWMAPEVIQQMPVSSACDIFSYGVVLWEMLTHEVPFKGLEGMQVAWLVVAREERLTIPTGCPKMFADLMTDSWLTEPKKRPTFKRVLSKLEKMLECGLLQEETDVFMQNKKCWMNEINSKLEELKKTERVLDVKAQQLFEREKQLEEREKLLQQRQAHKPGDIYDVNHWTKEQVANWVYSIGNSTDSVGELAQYAELFVENDINGKRLFKLTDEDLLHFRILSVGHRKELLEQIESLEQENKRLLHFPPLKSSSSKTQLRPPLAATVKTVQLTLIYGNMCRRGHTPSEHKWKMIFETDGDQEASSCVKEVTYIFSPMATVTVTPPHFKMDSWHVGKNPKDVECITQYHEYVKPQQTKFLIHPTESGVNEEITVELELRPANSDTLRETTLVPTISVEETHRDTVIPPPSPSSSASNKLQGDWAMRDRSIFTPPSQQQGASSRPRSRRGSNASETDFEILQQQQQTWANRVDRTPEKLPIHPQHLAAALECTPPRESSPRTPTSERSGQSTPKGSDPNKGINRRHSYEPTNTKQGLSNYRQGSSTPAMHVAGSQPKSSGHEYRSGSFGRGRGQAGRPSYKGQQSFQQSWPSSTLHQDYAQKSRRQRLPAYTAYNRSQSDTRALHTSAKEQSTTSVKSEPVHTTGGSGEWTEVRRKTNKPKNPSQPSQGKSHHSKDRHHRR